jgi:hypothetical protein
MGRVSGFFYQRERGISSGVFRVQKKQKDVGKKGDR